MRTYRELAEDYGRQGQAQLRDRFLILAADAALAAGREGDAELLRGRLLLHNPHHLLKPYHSFAEAMKATDVQNYVGGLRRSHPHDKAEVLLEGLRRDAKFGTGKGAPPPAEADVKVIRMSDRPEEPKASPTLSRQPSPSPLPPALTPVRATPAPETLPLQRDPYAALDKLRRAALEREDREPISGAWVSTGLFLLLSVMGIILAVYTALRPFLPQAWFHL
jgi:hypothetical protein